MAAGLTLPLEKLDAFIDSFEQSAREYPQEIFAPRGKVDMVLDLDAVSRQLLDALKELEPHGQGNPSPTFAARKVSATVRKAFGKDKNHLRILLDGRAEGVFWRGGGRYCRQNGECVDVIFKLEWDDFLKKPGITIIDVGHFF